METQKVHLTKEKETLLATLYGRALDYRSKDPILGDKFANDVIQKIDHDYSRFRLDKTDLLTVALRAKHLDEWTREFLASNPVSTVLHLGCGLDSRVFRINPPATVRWYDVDYPEVIELRRRLYPERPDYIMIGSSVTDQHWLDEIPVDRPVLIVAEGLVMYLSENDGIELFKCITGHFTTGQFIFDAFSRLAVRLGKLDPTIRTIGVSVDWGIDDPRELEKSIPRLKLITEFFYTDIPEYNRLPLVELYIWRIIGHIAFMKRIMRLLRYNF